MADNGRWPAHGVVDEVRIYGRALSDREQAELYAIDAPSLLIRGFRISQGTVDIEVDGPSDRTPLVLESRNLATTDWQVAPNQVVVSTNGTHRVSIPVDGGHRYYRLADPR